MKSGNLNFLESSGPLQACNETALPFIFSLSFFFLLALQPPVFYSPLVDFSLLAYEVS